MTFKLWVSRSSFISLNSGVEYFSRFARTAILSRLLVPSEFGAAVAISVVLGITALIVDVAFDKFVMFSNNARATAAAHMLSVMRGGLVALVLALSASNIAGIFGVPQYTTSFALAAFIPLLQSFTHFGIKQVQRNFEYAPEALSAIFAQLAALAAVIASAYILRDHRAVLIGFAIEAIVFTICSHVFARTPYKLRSDRAMFRAAFAFGLPLTLNGVGLALIAQFDRVLVGHWFGVHRLAVYAIILNMAVTPIGLMLRVFGTMALSYLLSKKDDPYLLSKKNDLLIATEHYSNVVYIFATLAAAYALFVALTLDKLTPLIFGQAYTVDPEVHILVTAIVFLRLQLGGAPTNLLLATGRTIELALLNLSSGIGLVIAFGLIYWRPNLESMLFGLLLGDLLRFPLFFIVSAKGIAAGWRVVLIDQFVAFFVLAVIIGALAWNPEFTWTVRSTILAVAILALVVQFAVGLRNHKMVRSLFMNRHPK